MHPLGTKVYLLKRYSPRDSFCTFFSESVEELELLKQQHYTLKTDEVKHEVL